MKKHISSLRAFTLVELMVVIAIIAILTGIVMTSATAARARARDAKRISDIGQLQLGIEVFYDRCRRYPDSPLDISVANSGQGYLCPGTNIMLKNYLSKLPTSPDGTTYDYNVNSTNANNDYFLHVTLETSNEVVKDAMSIKPSWYTGSLTCSIDPTQKQYCINPN